LCTHSGFCSIAAQTGGFVLCFLLGSQSD
jgi:hypothetical protein